MAESENKVRNYPQLSTRIMMRIFREERYRYHYETIMTGHYLKWYQLYMHKLFEVLNGNNRL